MAFSIKLNHDGTLYILRITGYNSPDKMYSLSLKIVFLCQRSVQTLIKCCIITVCQSIRLVGSGPQKVLTHFIILFLMHSRQVTL